MNDQVVGIVYASKERIYAIGMSKIYRQYITQFFINKIKSFVPNIINDMNADPQQVFPIIIITEGVKPDGLGHLRFELVEQFQFTPQLLIQHIQDGSIMHFLSDDSIRIIRDYNGPDINDVYAFKHDAQVLYGMNDVSNVQIYYADSWLTNPQM